MSGNPARGAFGERFLALPDLFPGRISGESWGSKELLVDLAGGPFRLAGLDERRHEVLARRFLPRLLDYAPAAPVELRLLRAPDDDFLPVPSDPWELDFDLEHAETSVRLAGHRMAGRVDGLPSPAGGLWLPGATDETELCGAVENFLRVLVAYRVLEQGGALLHSAGVLAGGGAWAFVGRSGAGKSTAARLSAARGLEVLSDELNALWLHDGEPRLERMPFAGELGQLADRRADYPLREVLLLRQGPRAGRAAVSRGEALAELAAASPFLNIDPWRNARLLDNLEQLTTAVRVERLTFALDAGFWDILLDQR